MSIQIITKAGSLYQFKRDEIATGDADVDIGANNVESKPFDYRAEIVGNVNGNAHTAKLVVPLKYLSNFFRSLGLPLIN